MFKYCCSKLSIFKKSNQSSINKSFSSIHPTNNSSPSRKSLIGKYKINPLNEIKLIEGNIQEQLGEGGASVVYKYVYNNKVYACKKISKRREVVEREINIMSIYKDNKYIVKYFGCHLNENTQTPYNSNKIHGPPKPHYIFMEYCQGKELFEVLRQNYDYRIIINITYQLLLAIKHLQKYKIVHADIKLENIIINNRYEIKLIDFGLSRMIKNGKSKQLSTHIGTVGYVSPEVMVDNYLTFKTDIWSVGILTYILLNNSHLFDVVDRATYRKQLENLQVTLQKGMFINNLTVPIEKYNDIHSFLVKTICYTNNRFSLKKCLQQKMFLNVDSKIQETSII